MMIELQTSVTVVNLKEDPTVLRAGVRVNYSRVTIDGKWVHRIMYYGRLGPSRLESITEIGGRPEWL